MLKSVSIQDVENPQQCWSHKGTMSLH